MVCPDCGKEVSATEATVCPFCGAKFGSGVIKTSTILISAGGNDAVYRSVDEIPEGLRGQFIKSTSGFNAATIIIADRRGRNELARALRNLPQNLARPPEAQPPAPPQSLRVLRWLVVSLILVSSLLIGIALYYRSP